MSIQNKNAPQGKRNKRKPRKITASYLHNAGLFYLQRYSSSAENFRTVMKRKIDRSCRFHDDDNRDEYLKLLDDLIINFTRSGLLDDQAYARAQVISLRRKGFGARAICARLKAKGLSLPLIKEMLETEENENNATDFKAALRLIQRRRLGPFRRESLEDDDEDQARKRRNRELAALARAGFGYNIAGKVLSLEIEEVEDLLNS